MTTCNEKKKSDILFSKNFSIPHTAVVYQLYLAVSVQSIYYIIGKKKSLYYITGSEIREGSESIFLFQRVLFNNALPEATAVQDGTRANCQKCSWKPP